MNWIAIFFASIALVCSLLLVTSYIFSNTILFSRRLPIVRSPADCGMPFVEVEFRSTDGLILRGWMVPGKGRTVTDAPERMIIQTHPLPFNRHGFNARHQGFPPLSFTNVDLLKTTKALHEAGYAVLLFDFRNHGRSEAGRTGVGLTEYQDVLGAIRYIRSRWPACRQIGFMSFCMGANATLAALVRGGSELEPVKFLVAVQPVSADVFIRSYLRSVYTPLSLILYPLIDGIVQMRGGFPLSKMTPLPFAGKITVPVLYIQARQDPWTELSDTQSFFDATPGEKEIWWIEDVRDRFQAYNYVGDHPQRALDFIQTHFR